MFCSAFAVVWELFTLIEFCLPTIAPINSKTFNYTIIFVVVGMILIIVAWFSYGKVNYLVDVIEGVRCAETSQVMETTLDQKNSNLNNQMA